LARGLMEQGYLGYEQITPHLSRIHNIGEKGLHSNQVYFRLQRDGKHPYSTEAHKDWSQVELFAMSHDGSPYQIEHHGLPKKTSICKQDGCVLPKTWKSVNDKTL